MSDTTERLISGLVDDLEPVRPIPRVRSAFAVILAIWAALLGVILLAQEGTPGARSLLQNPIYLASFVGMIIAACGAMSSALASGVPGREGLETAGLWLAFLGLAAAAIACLLGIVALGLHVESPPGADGMCFRHGAALSLLPAGVIIGFMVRGWTAHPIRAAAIALVASGAIGGSIIHLSCSSFGPMHLLMGHLSVPLVLACLGLYPLGVLLRRIRR